MQIKASTACLLLACARACVTSAAPSHPPTALLVVDVQGCFLPGGPVGVSGDADALVAAINRLRREGNFQQVVWTQDWHPPNHVSFAETHANARPKQTLQLAYTCVGSRWLGLVPGGPRLCNMTALYPDESVTCDGAEGHTTTHQQQQQQQQRQQQRAHADDKGGAGQSWGSRASQVLGRGLDAAAAAGAAAGVARQLKAAAEGVRGALKQAAGALKGGACAEPDTRVEQALWPRHCVRHTRGAALHARLDVRPRDVLLRKGWQPHLDAYSAFEDNGGLLSTGLAEQLRGAGVSAVVVAGVALDYCVLWTALHAAAAGFDTAVVLQATLPVDSGAGARAAVRRLRQAGVRVVRRVSDVVGS